MNSKDKINGIYIIALYNGDKLISCATEEMTTVVTEYVSQDGRITTAEAPTSYKIFFWNSLTELKPHCMYTESII